MDSSRHCEICHNPKRPLRFCTPRLAICQWCISALKSAEQTPDQVERDVRLHIEAKIRAQVSEGLAVLEASRPWPPQSIDYELAQVADRALKLVKREETPWASLYRSLWDATARTSEVRLNEDRLRQAIEQKYASAVSDFQERLNEITQRSQKLVDSLDEIEAEVSARYTLFLNERLAPKKTSRMSTKILRAYHLGIIVKDGVRVPRLVGPELESIYLCVRRGENHVCAVCQRVPRGSELHVHHIIPLANCGTNAQENLVSLCHACHNHQHPDIDVPKMLTKTRRKKI